MIKVSLYQKRLINPQQSRIRSRIHNFHRLPRCQPDTTPSMTVPFKHRHVAERLTLTKWSATPCIPKIWMRCYSTISWQRMMMWVAPTFSLSSWRPTHLVLTAVADWNRSVVSVELMQWAKMSTSILLRPVPPAMHTNRIIINDHADVFPSIMSLNMIKSVLSPTLSRNKFLFMSHNWNAVVSPTILPRPQISARFLATAATIELRREKFPQIQSMILWSTEWLAKILPNR